jgi:hypothetical protein
MFHLWAGFGQRDHLHLDLSLAEIVWQRKRE